MSQVSPHKNNKITLPILLENAVPLHACTLCAVYFGTKHVYKNETTFNHEIKSNEGQFHCPELNEKSSCRN
jgi:hypothetical protein